MSINSFVILPAAFISILAIADCSSSAIPKVEKQCISLPATSASSDKDFAAKFALELKKLPIDANLETTYKAKSTVVFDKISETNTAMLILLQGTVCLQKQGADPEVVKKLIDAVYRLALGKLNVAGAGENRVISATAKQQIEKGQFATEILQLLEGSGYRVE